MEAMRNINGGQDAVRSAKAAAEALASPPAPRHRAAIVDSDSGFVVVLERRLQGAGWQAEVLPKKTSLKRVEALDVEVVVVDPSMLGDGRMKWLSALCAARPEISVIACTFDSTVAERVAGLRAGIDDWLTKPCHPEEVVARLEGAALRRRRAAPGEIAPLAIGEIEIRPDQFQAFVGEDSLALTRREYQLLRLLSDAGGEVLARERIYECLWGYEMVRNDRSVDVFVHKLRRKLERRSPGWDYIHTHFGVGYRLAASRANRPAPATVQPLAA